MTKLYVENHAELQKTNKDDTEFVSEIKIGSTIFHKNAKVKKMLESAFMGCKLNAAFSEFREDSKHEYVDGKDLDLDGVDVLFQNNKGQWFTIGTSEWGGINFC
jgi:hypothetical protein